MAFNSDKKLTLTLDQPFKQKKNMSRHRMIELMMKEYLTQEYQQQTSQNHISLPMIHKQKNYGTFVINRKRKNRKNKGSNDKREISQYKDDSLEQKEKNILAQSINKDDEQTKVLNNFQSLKSQSTNKEEQNLKNGQNKGVNRSFIETFNPQKHEKQTLSSSKISINKKSFELLWRERSSKSHLQQYSQRSDTNNASKLINTDYVPGPGQYTIPSLFAHSEKKRNSILSSKNKTHLPSERSMSIKVLLEQKSLDGTFGVPNNGANKRFFKEYEQELRRRHSPGPGAYSPVSKTFVNEKYKSKTLSKDKRVCPIVPREQLLTQASPFSYNKPESSMKIPIGEYYGTKAERKVDARLFSQQHSYIVQKGLY